MYTVTSGIHISFSHHVRGHLGPCVSLHGHTWLFQVCFRAKELDHQGFVVDFDEVHERVLTPCHQLLDHALALGSDSFNETQVAFETLGTQLAASRNLVHGHPGEPQEAYVGELAGAKNVRPGGIKVCLFPFTPTSERIAEWLFRVAQSAMGDERVHVAHARIYESLHPSEAFADYYP